MINVDIVSLERINDRVLGIHDRYSSKYQEPKLDIELGGSSDYKLLGYTLGINYIKAKFKRKLNTGDIKYDLVLD